MAFVLQSLQLSGLRVLSSLAAGAAEGELPGEVLVPTSLLDRLLDLIRAPNTHQEVSGLPAPAPTPASGA
jgi:hypothetical protein